MEKKMVYVFSVFFLVTVAGAPVLHAVDEGLVETSDQAVEDESDPSAFEGDSGDMPGERAPEELPMSDAPADAGMSIR